MTREVIIEELQAREYVAEAVDTTKNGVVLKGITIGDGQIRPTIYTEQYEDADNVDMVVDEIIEAYENANREVPRFNLNELMNWDYVKTKLRLCLQRKGTENIVKRDFLDLEQYVRVKVSDDATFKVTPEHLTQFGVSEDVLFHAAWDCTHPTITETDMAELMAEMFGMPVSVFEENFKGPKQIVVSNKEKMNGAIAICDLELLARIADKYKADLTILPSSIHECILVPMTGDLDFDGLSEMVSDVNGAEVDPVEQLSDHAYYYNRAERKVTWK